jgi:histone H2A
MAAVLEYVCAEVLELSGDLCLQHKNKIIQPRHINLGLRSDDELSKLISTTTISASSVAHHVNSFLLPNKGKKAAAAE